MPYSPHQDPSLLLGLDIFINTATLRTVCVGTGSLGKFFHQGTMDILLKNWLCFDLFELSLEIFETGSVGAAIGATTSIGHIEAFVLDFFTIYTPIFDMLADEIDDGKVHHVEIEGLGWNKNIPSTLSSTIFLGFLRVSINMTGLCEIAGQMLLWKSSTIGEASMIAIIVLV